MSTFSKSLAFPSDCTSVSPSAVKTDSTLGRAVWFVNPSAVNIDNIRGTKTLGLPFLFLTSVRQSSSSAFAETNVQ